MTVRSRSRPTTSQEPAWTPRQRVVLDLLIKGRPNGQIAEELNISLDGAKWHVSEILTKLGVDTREEAADYWRRRTGLAPRLYRLFSAVFTASGLKWAGVGTGLLLTASAVALGIAALVSHRGDSVDGSPNPDQSTESRPRLTGELMGNVPVEEVIVGSSTPLPEGLVVYYEVGLNKNRDVRRLYRDSDGDLREESVFAPLGNIFSFSIHASEGLLGAAVCEHGDCGAGSFSASADARARGYLSTDGGVSYTDLGLLPANALLHELFQQQLVLALYDPSNQSPPGFQLFPSGTELVSPRTGAVPVYAGSLGLVWRADNGAIYSAGGDLLRAAPDGGFNGLPRAEVPLSLQSWVRPVGTPDAHWYVGFLDNSGEIRRVLSSSREIRPVARLGDRVIGNYSADSSGSMPPMLLDLKTSTIHPIEEFASAVASGRLPAWPLVLGVASWPSSR